MNYIQIKRFSFFYYYFAFVDTTEHLADTIFIQKKLSVHFIHELRKKDTDYCIVFCRIRKSDADAFSANMEALQRKMLLLGHDDYADFCMNFKNGLNNEAQKEEG